MDTSTSSSGGRVDWTETYQYWDKYEEEPDHEGNEKKKREQEERYRTYMAQPGAFMGHDHDHAVERKLLEKSEIEKMAYCENHRRLGNYLFLESIYPKAAEQYQLALSYYEYCFPEDDDMQTELDGLRHACLCNISLCYYRMKQWRMAVQSAGQVLEEDPINAKALYRRAQAYRALDEYESAEKDIVRAQGLSPADKGIAKEIQALHAQRRSAVRDEKTLAMQMLGDGRQSNQKGQHGDTYSAADLAADDEQEAFLHWSPPASNGRMRQGANTGGHSGIQKNSTIECLSVALPLEPILPTALLV